MARGEDTRSHPGRQVGRDAFGPHLPSGDDFKPGDLLVRYNDMPYKEGKVGFSRHAYSGPTEAGPPIDTNATMKPYPVKPRPRGGEWSKPTAGPNGTFYEGTPSWAYDR